MTEEALASQFTPEQVNRMLASEILDPLDDGWQQHATIGAAVCNLLAAILDEIRQFAGKPIGERKTLEADDLIPMPEFLRELRQRDGHLAQRQQDMTAEELRAAHKKQFGSK